MAYVNFNHFNYRFILATSISAIVWTAPPVWAHAPEYHVPSEQSEPEEASSPATAKPTPDATPNLSEQETTAPTTTCTEDTCATDLQLSPGEKKSAYRLPTGEFVLLLLAIGPFMMVGIKQRLHHHHK